MLLITNCLELGVVAGISQMLADRHHAVSSHHPAMALRSRFQKDIFVAWQGNGLVCVNETWLYCVNQMGKTQSKALAERHGMCESTLIGFPSALLRELYRNTNICILETKTIPILLVQMSFRNSLLTL
jgi:hypothetical protein